MFIICCLDNRNGIRFNRRRQSRDIEIYRDISRLVGNAVLHVSRTGAALFDRIGTLHCAVVDPESLPDDTLWFFTERPFSRLLDDRADRLIVYRWNRDYPADEFADLTGWRLIESLDFRGSSHETITREVYTHG